MSKLLQSLGALALLGWTGAGFAAWMLTKEQVHLTIEEGAGERLTAVDPVADLGERVFTLQGDLRSLAGSLGKNFEMLDNAAAERAAEATSASETARDEMRRELERAEHAFAGKLARALEDERRHGAAELVALRAEIAALGSVLRDGARAQTLAQTAPHATRPADEKRACDALLASERNTAAPDAGETAPAKTPEERASAPDQLAATEGADTAERPSTTAAPTPGKKRSFVAFDLPSDSFSFEGRRTWEIVPSLSRVGFDAQSTLHDFSGVTQRVRGDWTADLAHPEVDPQGSISADAGSLDTGLADRNAAMYEKLETARHLSIAFRVSSFRATSIDAQGLKLSGVVRGTLAVHGVEREIEMAVKLAVDSSRRLNVEGEAKLKMSDFGLEPPSQLGMISMQDEVKIWIALRARSSAPKQS